MAVQTRRHNIGRINVFNFLSRVQVCAYVYRALTEMQHDVKEAREAIAEVADNNAILAAVCLTEGATALDWSTTSHKPLHM